MKAFVTGGTGFIGSHLVDALLQHNAYSEVRCLIRNNQKWLKDKDITPIRGNLDDFSTLKQAVEGVDVIFHIAGRVKAPTYKQLKRANVDATENLLRVAQKAGTPKVVVLSSLAAAGPSKGQPVTEDDPLEPVSMYGKSKKQMEQRIHELIDNKMSVTILRPPAVYGPREDQIYSFFKMVSKRICPIIGDGEKPKISMIYVGDVVQAILKASQQNEPGIHTYFISDGEPHTWNKIRETATMVFGKKAIPIYVKPDWVQKIAGIVEKTGSFFGIYPVLNKEKAKEMILEWTCSSDKAQQELGYKPEFSLEEGISRTIHWYQRHHWL
ncbi:NAD-dependent epimerase/dehydratase family protein [Fodinibius salsisoli]|uniref:NAD(P)-dependent oxidoreductase n=1 Tax=Fodinibius salsisoli TaxID=2820877 RepID=A0ABT3PPA1_9BACT|nr:NAD(P)-dependent oxidoreductase [Fodinibius salsisoli]MCW9707694.1 NAD(P)-dependent oxidoreductase [Fodinibius salsisoli]